MDLILGSGYRTEFSDPFFSKLTLRHGRLYDVVREALARYREEMVTLPSAPEGSESEDASLA